MSKYMCDNCHEAYMYCACPDNPLNEDNEIKKLKQRIPVAKYNALQEECDGRMQAIKKQQQKIEELYSEYEALTTLYRNTKSHLLDAEQRIEELKAEVKLGLGVKEWLSDE